MLQYRQGGAAGGWYVSVLLNFIVIWMIAHPQPPNPPTPSTVLFCTIHRFPFHFCRVAMEGTGWFTTLHQ